jgi:hypothetical protein
MKDFSPKNIRSSLFAIFVLSLFAFFFSSCPQSGGSDPEKPKTVEIPAALQGTTWTDSAGNEITFTKDSIIVKPAAGTQRTYAAKDKSSSGTTTTVYFNDGTSTDYVKYDSSSNAITEVYISNINKTPGWSKDPVVNPNAITYTVTQIGGQRDTVNTTGLSFSFSESVDSLNLTEADVLLYGSPASKGTAKLTGTGRTRTLSPITINEQGNSSVSITKAGVETGWKSVAVYKKTQDDNVLNFVWEENPGFEWNENDGGIAIRGYVGLGGDIVIPDTINGKPVTVIGNNILAWPGPKRENITSITFPNSVHTIKDNSFGFIFTTVVLPSSLVTIGKGVFQSNYLSNIIIPNGVKTIGERAFDSNKLTTVNIPGSVNVIGSYAFSRNQLTSVTISNGVTTIGSHAFAENKLTSITFPDSVREIGGAVGTGNPITSITIGADVVVLEGNWFFRGAYITNGLKAGTYTRKTTQGMYDIDEKGKIWSYNGVLIEVEGEYE